MSEIPVFSAFDVANDTPTRPDYKTLNEQKGFSSTPDYSRQTPVIYSINKT